MKNRSSHTFWILVFLFLTFPLSLVFALPLQNPLPGTYQCFIAGANPLALEVQNAGASLVLQGESYTLTTATASETGTFTAREIVVEDTTSLDTNFQSGTELLLIPQSGSASYVGLFLVDRMGGYTPLFKIVAVFGFAVRVKMQTCLLRYSLLLSQKLKGGMILSRQLRQLITASQLPQKMSFYPP